MVKRFLVGFLILAGASLATPALAAQQSITITPTSTAIQVQPGSVTKGTFQILNQGQVSYPFDVYATSYHVKGEDYTPDFTPLPGTTDISSWFSFVAEHQLVDPGQTVNVNYTLTIPNSTPAGGYYGVAFAATQFPQIPGDLVINQTVGEVFYLQVGGDVSAKGGITSWKANLWQPPPLTATLKVQNDSSTHYFANIQVKVRDVLGGVKYSFNDSKVVLPQTIRRVNILWPKSPPIGLFKVTGTVEFLGQTHTLPTQYVFLLSPTLRRSLPLVALLLVALLVLRFVVKNTLKYHKSRKSQ